MSFSSDIRGFFQFGGAAGGGSAVCQSNTAPGPGDGGAGGGSEAQGAGLGQRVFVRGGRAAAVEQAGGDDVSRRVDGDLDNGASQQLGRNRSAIARGALPTGREGLLRGAGPERPRYETRIRRGFSPAAGEAAAARIGGRAAGPDRAETARCRRPGRGK